MRRPDRGNAAGNGRWGAAGSGGWISAGISGRMAAGNSGGRERVARQSPDPSSSPAGRFAIPVSSHTLANGLRVFLMERPRLPIVSLTLLLEAGLVEERPEDTGLAGLTVSLLPRGTTKRDATRLAADVDALGASLGVHADYDYSMLGLSSLAGDLGEACSILGEVATSPAFLGEEIERRRHDVLSGLERRKDNPNERVRDRFLARVYGDHPYHHPPAGTPESVARIDEGAIRGFYDRLFRPNNAMLAVVGDIDPGETLRLLEEHFGRWAPAEITRPSLPALPEAAGLGVEQVDKRGMTQATLRVGGLCIRRSSPDYVPVVLMNHILGGGGFGTRLMKSLREESGLSYGAFSTFHPRREPGYFFASCQTGLATMNEALQRMLEEIARLRDEGVTGDELERACRFYTGSLPLSLETNDQLATRVLEREFYDLEENYWIREVERMGQVTVAEVNEAARRYLDPARFTVVCLADFEKVSLALPR